MAGINREGREERKGGEEISPPRHQDSKGEEKGIGLIGPIGLMGRMNVCDLSISLLQMKQSFGDQCVTKLEFRDEKKKEFLRQD